ncbi:uncharacterized protein [Montipora foliosa]|uniref:uncharacterized protein isoform X2 n=1 Tax=Montipora foliosa TaxID=591990 RepID=UPI0035F0FDA1
MDSPTEEQTCVKYSKRAFTRTFVFLYRPLTKAPSGKMMESLKANGRSVDVTFTRNHSDAAMGRLLLASFPSLMGVNLKSLTFVKSYEKGHAMATVKNGLLNGEEIVRHYSAAHKKKIYFYLQLTATCTSTCTSASASTQATPTVDLTHTPQSGATTRRLLTAMAQRAGVSYEDDANALDGTGIDHEEMSDGGLDCIITSASSSSSGSRHDKGNVKVLTVDPEVVGSVIEDLSTFGFSDEKNKDDYPGRTAEVASIIKMVEKITKGKCKLPPFMTHTLNEMLWQAREDGAVCLLVLFSQNNSEEFIDRLFKILNNQLRKHNKEVFIWVAYSQSNEGSKVQAKYGVGEQTALLVVVPSQIPQCVDILNETNINEGRVQEALVNALQMFSHLKRKGINLTRTSSSREKAMKESLVITENSEVEDTNSVNGDDVEDSEVTFGPVPEVESENLEKTVEDKVDEGVGKESKRKKRKKKNKKNKKKKGHHGQGEVDAPPEKKPRVEQ